jgi:hypothetical protein
MELVPYLNQKDGNLITNSGNFLAFLNFLFSEKRKTLKNVVKYPNYAM